jgi:hypothetical protein
MGGPGTEMAAGAGDSGHLRASHADREQVIGTLKAAFVAGMLAKDEFDLRVSQTFASRTHADLAALTADIPTELTAVQPPQPARVRGKRRLLRPGPVIMAATVLYAGLWAPAFLLPPGPANPEGDPPRALILLFLSSNVIYPLVVVIAVAFMVAGWREKRSGRRPPQRPARGAGGQTSRRLPSASPDPRTGQNRADLSAHWSRQHRQHVPSRAARAPRGVRPAPGAV